MTVAFDAFTSNEGTGTRTFDHNPVGTPRGVLIMVVHNNEDTNHVTGVTYGGTTVPATSGSPNLLTTGEIGAATSYHLGESVPTDDPAEVVVTLDDATNTVTVGVYTVTAGGDTAVTDSDGTINSTAVANPSVTLSLGGLTAFAAIAFQAGGSNVNTITPLSGWTGRNETDYGQQVGGFYSYDTIGSSDVTAGWSQGTNDAVAMAVAIHEIAPLWDQDRYRIGSDSGTNESDYTFVAALNTAYAAVADTNFFVRVSIQNATSGGSITLKAQYRLNEATWTDVTTSSSVFRATAAVVANLTDGNDTTDRLGATGTFLTPNGYQDETGAVAALTYATGEQSEILLCGQVRSADTKYGDKVEIRWVESDNTVLDTYTNTPTLWRSDAEVTFLQTEQVTGSLGATALSATDTLTTTLTDEDKAFLVYGYRSDDVDSSPMFLRGVITNTTTVTFDRFDHSSNAIEALGYVAEFSAGVRVERGTITEAQIEGGTGGQFSVALSNIFDLSKAWHTASVIKTVAGTTIGDDDALESWLSESGGVVSINVQLNETGTNADQDVSYQVIQYEDCLVKRNNETGMNASTTSISPTLSPAVDVDKTFYNVSCRNPDGAGTDLGLSMLRARQVAGGATFTIDREHHGSVAISSISWEAIEFTGSETVEEVLETFNAADGQEDFTLTLTLSAIANAIAFASFNQRMGRTDWATDDNLGETLTTGDITSTSNLQTLRTATGGVLDVAWYVIDFAGGSATKTLTASADSLLRKQDILLTASADSLLQKLGIEQTLSADALLQKTVELTLSADSLLQKNVIVTALADALLQKLNVPVTTSADALLIKLIELTLSADALLQKTVTVTTSADALLQILNQTLTASADSLLQKPGVTVTTSADAVVLKNVMVTALADALLQKTDTKTLSADALLQGLGITRTLSADAVLSLAGTTLTMSADALIQALGVTRTTSADALLQLLNITVTVSADALLQKAVVSTLSADALLLKTVLLTASADALLRKLGVPVTLSADAVLVVVGAKTLTLSADALLQAFVTLQLSADAVLQLAIAAGAPKHEGFRRNVGKLMR